MVVSMSRRRRFVHHHRWIMKEEKEIDWSRPSRRTLKIHERRNREVDQINSIVRLLKNWRQTMRFNPFIWGLDKRFFSTSSIRFHSIDRPFSRFARLLCWFLLTANEDLRDQSFTSRSERERWRQSKCPYLSDSETKNSSRNSREKPCNWSERDPRRDQSSDPDASLNCTNSFIRLKNGWHQIEDIHVNQRLTSPFLNHTRSLYRRKSISFDLIRVV